MNTLETRGTQHGKSTELALECILRAIKNPTIPVKIITGRGRPTDNQLSNLVNVYIRKLDLNLEVNRDSNGFLVVRNKEKL